MDSTLYNALYARQSIEKKDSISVESQLAYCRCEAHGEACIEYTDRGFSGGNTNRPAFEQMMQEIRSGRIKRVIVYKLDRISRSILDFANMMELFQQYHVEFVSSTEKFDTSTPIGRAMLHICIVFAQLERETIQKRVTDAYYARSRRGFYMGGRIPYGYRLADTVIDRIRTSMYEEVPAESRQLKLIYSLYADTDNSLGDIVRYLKEHGIQNRRGADWSTARLSEMLRNPIYVEADIDVYRFFQSQGTHIHSPAADFTGNNACYLYQGADAAAKKSQSLAGKELILAPHKGFIPSSLWLACRQRSLNSRQSAKTCKPKNSWLAGKVKCGRCGYALTIRKANTKWERYFICSRSGCHGNCTGTGCTVYADVLEEYIGSAILARLPEFLTLPSEDIPPAANEPDSLTRLKEIKISLAQIEEEIESLLSKVAEADHILMQYINEKISRLDAERKRLQTKLTAQSKASPSSKTVSAAGCRQTWELLPFAKKQAAVDLLIRVIHIADGHLTVEYHI